MRHSKKIFAVCAVMAGLFAVSVAQVPDGRHQTLGDHRAGSVQDRHQGSVPGGPAGPDANVHGGSAA